MQVSLSIAILNNTADGARQVAAGYANNVISAVKQVRSHPFATLARDFLSPTFSQFLVHLYTHGEG